MYYQLYDHCKLVTGKKRGAIYDLRAGKVFSVNAAAVRLLNEYRQKPLPDEWLRDGRADIQFLDALTKKGLGGLYAAKPPAPAASAVQKPTSSLEFAWLELTARCNNRCRHCYTESTGTETPGSCVAHERWLELIAEIRATGCKALQFIGGEPLLYPRWRELVLKARGEGFDFIEIFTNATLLDDSSIAFIAEHKLHVATTLYAANAAIHDDVTQNKGSFEKTLQNIRKLLANQTPLRVASILMKTNENETDSIIHLCKELGVEAAPPDVVRPTGRGDDASLLPQNARRPEIRPPFYTSETEFALAHHLHPCLAGKIAVTTTGDVLPCIFARGIVYGNILTQPLAEILSGRKTTECWQTTKDNVRKCRDCEYRYACPDCRPLAAANGDWSAPPENCAYDPLEGIWRKTDVTQDAT